MSDNPENIPDGLSTLTPLPVRKPGDWEPRNRRPRSNVQSERANDRFTGKRGEKIFRIVRNNKTMRAWAVGRKIDVKERGPIPDDVQEQFDEWLKINGLWTVTVISLMPPGATDFSQFYQVRQGQVLTKMTTDPFYVKREMGEEVFGLLTPPRRINKKGN